MWAESACWAAEWENYRLARRLAERSPQSTRLQPLYPLLCQAEDWLNSISYAESSLRELEKAESLRQAMKKRSAREIRRCCFRKHWQTYGSLKFSLARREAELAGQPLQLTGTEFALLSALLEQPGRVLSRQELLDRVWGTQFCAEERTVDSHLRNLRAKFKQADSRQRILAVRGVGYKFLA